MAVFSSEVAELTKGLIETLTGIERSSSRENYKLCFKYVRSNFKHHRFLDVNELHVTRAIKGLKDKFTIHSQPERAERLQELSDAFLHSNLESHFAKSSAHYGVLQFLLCLADSPVNADYVPPPPATATTAGPGSHFDWYSYLMQGIEYPCYSDDDSEWSELTSLEEEEGDGEDTLGSEEGEGPKPYLNDSAVELGDEALCDDDITLVCDDITLVETVTSPYWTQHTLFSSPSSSSSHPACNLAADWRAYHNSLSPYSTLPEASTLTEAHLLRETIWVLLGAEHSFLYWLCDGCVGVRSDLQVSHLTPLALAKQLECLAAMATRLHQIRSFSRKPTGSVTCDAFAAGLSVWLEDVLSPVRSIEKALVAVSQSDDCMTLMKLSVELQATDRQVRDMHEVFVSCTANTSSPTHVHTSTVLDALWSALQYYDNMGSTGHYMLKVLFPLWLVTLHPYLSQLEHWMDSGELPHSEFCIQRSEVAVSSADYWQKCFAVQQPVPAFLSPVLDEVVLAGKSVHIIQTVGQLKKVGVLDSNESLYQAFIHSLTSELDRLEMRSHEPPSDRVTAESHTLQSVEMWDFDPLMMHYITSLHVSQTTSTDSSAELWRSSSQLLSQCGSLQAPLFVVLQSSLQPLLHQKYLKACGALVDLLRSNFALTNHFTVIQKTFLMGDGEAMHHLTSDIFQRIRCRECWLDQSYLNTVLLESLGNYSTELEGRLSVVCSDAAFRNQPTLDAITAICLQYKVPWPLETVFSCDLMEKYGCVFHYLLQVRWAKWSLEQLQTRACLLAGLPRDLAMKLHLFHLFRSRLLHFVNSLNNYLMTRILHSVGMEFTRNIAQASDLEAIITLHRNYVTTIFDRCLLNKKVGYVKEAILNILRLALSFRQQWDEGISKFSCSDAEKMEVKFTKCSHFLVSCLKSTVKRGTFPHLETLAFSLEFLGSQQKIFTPQNMSALLASSSLLTQQTVRP